MCTHYGIAYERMANVRVQGWGEDCARRFERTGWELSRLVCQKCILGGSEEESAREEEEDVRKCREVFVGIAQQMVIAIVYPHRYSDETHLATPKMELVSTLYSD